MRASPRETAIPGVLSAGRQGRHDAFRDDVGQRDSVSIGREPGGVQSGGSAHIGRIR
jgi:hypothetical protein